jgi:hypothetical protein
MHSTRNAQGAVGSVADRGMVMAPVLGDGGSIHGRRQRRQKAHRLPRRIDGMEHLRGGFALG